MPDTTVAIWGRDARRETGGTHPLVVADPEGATRGTVLLIHGRNGAPDQPHIDEIARAYLDRGWRVAAPELPFSGALPDSGPSDKVTLSGHAAAARAVWDEVTARWGDGPMALAGHSLGGYAVAKIAGAAPGAHHVLGVSPVLSGARMLAARVAMGPPAVAALEREVPDMRAEMEREDATADLAACAVPAGVVTGAADGLVRLADARDWFGAAAHGVFFGALPGVHHCPTGDETAAMLRAALTALDA